MTRALRRARARGDRGFTTVELIVAIGIFSIVISVVMAGVVMMTRATVRTDVTAMSGDAQRLVFQRLDREVRYAEAINLPGHSTGGGNSEYVEFRVGATVSATGQPMCTQWRWDRDTLRLQRRTWVDTATPTVPGWSTVIEDVQPASGRYPFELLLAQDAKPRQRLVLRLEVGKPGITPVTQSSTTFVARNSSTNSISNVDSNNDGRSDIPVCLASAGRP